MNTAPLLTRSELAARWRISDYTIRRMMRDGTLDPVRFSRGHVFFRPADIERLEAQGIKLKK